MLVILTCQLLLLLRARHCPPNFDYHVHSIETSILESVTFLCVDLSVVVLSLDLAHKGSLIGREMNHLKSTTGMDSAVVVDDMSDQVLAIAGILVWVWAESSNGFGRILMEGAECVEEMRNGASIFHDSNLCCLLSSATNKFLKDL